MTDINDILNGKKKKITTSVTIGRANKTSNISVEDVEIDNVEVDKGGRPKKDIIYKEERKQVLNNLFNILSVSKSGDIFYIDDIDNDINKQNQILALEDSIKMYFCCSGWGCFSKNGVQKKYLSFVKSILKYMNIKMVAVSLIISETRKVIRQGYKVDF